MSIAAKDYLAEQPKNLLDQYGMGADLDRQQPDVGFSFGSQPMTTRNADILEGGKRRKVGIVGAGDVYKKFLLPTYAQRGTELYITSHGGAEEAVTAAQENGLQAQAVSSISDMPKDLDYIVVLTPPGAHKTNIEEAMKTGLPIVVEKPLAGNREDVDAIEGMLKDYKAPVYCIDWEVMHALPLLAAAGVNMPFKDAMEGSPAEAYKAFDFNDIRHIDGRFVEGGDNSLGDLDYVKKNRPWLFDYCQGGGMLYDLAVHPLNVLAALGFKNAGLDDVYLGTPIKEGTDEHGKPVYKKGVYQRFGKMPPGEKTGEIYGRAEMALQRHDGEPSIDTVIEVAKGAAVNDGRLVMIDGKGNKLQWEMFPLD